VSELDLTMPIVELASRGLQHRPAPPTPIERGRALAAGPAPLRRRPLEPTLIICRDEPSRASARGVCALCWSGPGPLAGSVRQHNEDTLRAICSRCLVTLEMLAVQFDPQLRLRIETPA
jgi:hypothetical protein